ncbi:MAG: prepilin-type N-terminal cleavage/methylation domain-containing protein [Nitrospirae bacterium]|nr:prepilin-type N-terminal cleavage/methylation domain-containing protein [Nitrospirota bacterium]
MESNKPVLRNNSGFTLTEIMVTVAIFAIVLTAVFATFTSQFNSYQTQEDVATVQEDIRSAAETLTRDIRNAGYGVGLGEGINVIAAATPSSISLNLASSTSSTFVTSANFSNPSANVFIFSVASTSGFQMSQPYNVVDIRTKSVIMGKNAGDKITAIGPGNSLTFSGNLSTGVLNVGNVVVSPGVSSSGYTPVVYSVSAGTTTLTRTDFVSGAMELSRNVKSLVLNYTLTDGTSTSAPTAGQLGLIASVNFTINGETSNQISKLSGVKRARTVNVIVALRN